MAGNGGKMPNKWRVFYAMDHKLCIDFFFQLLSKNIQFLNPKKAFIKRGGRFLAGMQNRSLRRDFEQFLMSVGRHPANEKNEGWSDVMATSLDSQWAIN